MLTDGWRFSRGADFRGPLTYNSHFSLGLEFAVHQRLFGCSDDDVDDDDDDDDDLPVQCHMADGVSLFYPASPHLMEL